MSNVNDQLVVEDREQISRAAGEVDANARLLQLSNKYRPAFGAFWNLHQNVFLNRQALSRLLYYDEIYRLVVDVPGVICEFGTQWGATLVTLMNLRGIYEPYNHSRHIIGFDTFEGLTQLREEDGTSAAAGDYATSRGYEKDLEEILALHESLSPIPHIRKFQLVKGDATQSARAWFDENPQAIVSLAIFDMDLYEPTKAALAAVLPRLTRGSVLVFDELNAKSWPGETRALDDVIGLNNIRLQRHPHQPNCAFAIFEG